MTPRHTAMTVIRSCLAAGLAAVCAAPAPADWPTARGNPQRTGNLDDQPGPKNPKVLWVHMAPEQYIAPPVVQPQGIYIAALGPFNTGVFHALSGDAQTQQRVRWSKSAPYITRPVVCAPAVAEGLIVFGDGMHQTDDAILYCLQADTGRHLWQLPVPGKLIHLEASPTIANGRVFTGGGDAGVLCVDLRRCVLGDKELELAAAKEMIERRWTRLVAKYEEQKKAQGDLAVPPTDEGLPKPAPKLIWQRGKGAWHVDAPVTVIGEVVLAASAFLDEEKVGKRTLLCLKAADGAVSWEAPLKLNPWAGASVAGNLALVGCSSIRFDTKLIKQAQGEVVAVDLGSGQVKWRKDLPGGVLSPVAVKGDLAVVTCTDGKVRGLVAASGEQKWSYDAPSAFFGGPAVAGGVVYAADLKGVLHAVNLADGKPLWTLNVPGDPAVQAPGMVFASVAVEGGRVYVATCNVEGDAADRPSVVACIADASVVPQAKAGSTVAVDRDRRRIVVPCRIAPRKLPTLKEIYPLEVAATYPAPRGQKAHETVVCFDIRPSDVHKALESFGLKPGTPAKGDESPASGPQVRVYLELPGFTGKTRIVPIERTMIDRRTGKVLPPLRWLFTGSALRQPDPDKPQKVYAADLSGTLIALFPVTDETVIQTNMTMKESTLLQLETNRNLVPEEGVAVNLIIEAIEAVKAK